MLHLPSIGEGQDSPQTLRRPERTLILVVVAVSSLVLLLTFLVASLVVRHRANEREAMRQSHRDKVTACIERASALAAQEEFQKSLDKLAALENELWASRFRDEDTKSAVREAISKTTLQWEAHERKQVRGLVEQATTQAARLTAQYDYDGARELLRYAGQTLAESFIKEEAHALSLARTGQKVQAAYEEHRRRLDQGWVMFDGRFMSSEDRDAECDRRGTEVIANATNLARRFEFVLALNLLKDFERLLPSEIPTLVNPTKAKVDDAIRVISAKQLEFESRLARGYTVVDGRLVHSDVKKIQGAWEQINGFTVWKYTFAGDTMIIETGYKAFHGGIEVERSKFILASSKNPKWITWGDRGDSCCGIYKFEQSANVLTICWNYGESRRPRRFVERGEDEDTMEALYVFRRRE